LGEGINILVNVRINFLFIYLSLSGFGGLIGWLILAVKVRLSAITLANLDLKLAAALTRQ
jgi:hypothetical protein